MALTAPLTVPLSGFEKYTQWCTYFGLNSTSTTTRTVQDKPVAASEPDSFPRTEVLNHTYLNAAKYPARFIVGLVAIPVFTAVSSTYHTLMAAKDFSYSFKTGADKNTLRARASAHLHLAVMDRAILTCFTTIAFFHTFKTKFVERAQQDVSNEINAYAQGNTQKYSSYSGTGFFLNLCNDNKTVITSKEETLHSKGSNLFSSLAKVYGRFEFTAVLLPAFAAIGATFSTYLAVKTVAKGTLAYAVASETGNAEALKTANALLNKSVAHLFYAVEDVVSALLAGPIIIFHALFPTKLHRVLNGIQKTIAPVMTVDPLDLRATKLNPTPGLIAYFKVARLSGSDHDARSFGRFFRRAVARNMVAGVAIPLFVAIGAVYNATSAIVKGVTFGFTKSDEYKSQAKAHAFSAGIDTLGFIASPVVAFAHVFFPSSSHNAAAWIAKKADNFAKGV